MSDSVPGQMAPTRILLGGFVEEYDADDYPDVVNGLFVQQNYLMHDGDLPAPIQVFTEQGRVLRAMRLHLDGYFIVPMKHVALHPGFVFTVVKRMVELEGGAPWRLRVRFWIAGRLLAIAGRLMTDQEATP